MEPSATARFSRHDPCRELGPEVAEALAPHMERLAADVLTAVTRTVPPFREWLEGHRPVQRTVEEGVQQFLATIGAGTSEPLPGRDVYFDFGRSELRSGRSLDAVLTAYRAAAQAAWRGMADTGHKAGIEPTTLYRLAEALFAFVDRISTATVEGYAYEQSLLAGERGDARRRLVELLLRVPAPSAEELEVLAAEVRWPVPTSVAVLAFRHARTRRVAARLPVDALVTRLGGMGYAIVPDPHAPGRLPALRRGLADVRAALGPAVEPTAAAESARCARLALSLSTDAEGERLVLADEHRIDLLLLQDPTLAAAMAHDVLGPLAVLGPQAQDRLLETLAAWLEHQGEVRPAAEVLHVHVQTVRYRVHQLRELLGDRLSTAEGRLELELALRAMQLVARCRTPRDVPAAPDVQPLS